MGYYVDNDAIRVTARGTAEAEFASVTYRAKASKSAKTGAEAKALVQPMIEQIKSVVHEHAERGKIDTGRLKTTFAVDVDTNRHTGEFCGYKATYSIEFTGRQVSAATGIHDVLTSLGEVQAPTPVFNLDTTAEVQSMAFHDAVARARELFAGQCAALDLNPSDFYVLTWAVETDRPSGKTLSVASSSTGSVVEVSPGRAVLEVTVTLLWTRKPTATVAPASIRPPAK